MYPPEIFLLFELFPKPSVVLHNSQVPQSGQLFKTGIAYQTNIKISKQKMFKIQI